MNKVKKYTVISNVIICLVTAIVSVYCFMPVTNSVFNESVLAPYYCGDKSKNSVSIMFNVYENSNNVSKILDIAKQHNAKLTFFVGGCWADDNEQLLKRMVSENHEIGNHGYFHKDHKKLSFIDNKKEIENTNKVVKALCGYDITLFAPPSGSFGDNTLKVCNELGFNVIMWSKDTIDWRDHDVELIVKRATNSVSAGDFILMHPTNESVLALMQILEELNNKNLTVDTVTNLLNKG